MKLTKEEEKESLDFLLQDENELLIIAYLVLLRSRGETSWEAIDLIGSFNIYPKPSYKSL